MYGLKDYFEWVKYKTNQCFRWVEEAVRCVGIYSLGIQLLKKVLFPLLFFTVLEPSNLETKIIFGMNVNHCNMRWCVRMSH